MIKEPSEQTLIVLAALAKAVGGDGSFHITPIYVCDNCKDDNKEAFHYGVHDATGKFWDDLCNDCFDLLGCSCPDYPDEDDDSCHYCGGDGWGIVGLDWDCEDGVNGPYNGEIGECPNCHGSGKAKDMTFW